MQGLSYHITAMKAFQTNLHICTARDHWILVRRINSVDLYRWCTQSTRHLASKYLGYSKDSRFTMGLMVWSVHWRFGRKLYMYMSPKWSENFCLFSPLPQTDYCVQLILLSTLVACVGAARVVWLSIFHLSELACKTVTRITYCWDGMLCI